MDDVHRKGNPVFVSQRRGCALFLAVSSAVAGSASWACADPTITTIYRPLISLGDPALTPDAAGDLFGTDAGTIYELPAATHTFTSLTLYQSNDYQGTSDAALTLDAAGDLFGTTSGGTTGGGTIFELAAGSNTAATLATFTGAQGGGLTSSLTEDAAGNFYGTTTQGGANGTGTIFKFTPATGALSALASFPALARRGVFGQYLSTASNVVFDSKGDLFCTTEVGGNYADGSVDELPAGSNQISAVVSFNGTSLGSQPSSGLISDAAGNLYGTTFFAPVQGGFASNGSVFEFHPATGTLTTLAEAVFFGPDYPSGNLILDAAGNLFGVAESSEVGVSGAGADGAIFEVTPGSSTLTTVADFDGSNGSVPVTGLAADANGNLSGSTPNYDGNAPNLYELTGSGYVVPEPSGLALLAIFNAGLVVRRRRQNAL